MNHFNFSSQKRSHDPTGSLLARLQYNLDRVSNWLTDHWFTPNPMSRSGFDDLRITDISDKPFSFLKLRKIRLAKLSLKWQKMLLWNFRFPEIYSFGFLKLSLLVVYPKRSRDMSRHTDLRALYRKAPKQKHILVIHWH